MRKALLFFTFLTITIRINAQEILWQNTIGGDEVDELYSIIQSSDGGYLLGGNSSSNISGDKTEHNFGYMGYWVIKIDSIGTIQWQNSISGYLFDHLSSVIQTTDGGYLLGGYSTSGLSLDKTELSNGGIDYWIVKIDSIGNIDWQNTIGGNNDDYLHSIIQTDDGGYLLGGESCSSFSGDKSDSTNGGFDYWIIKTDTVGNVLWEKSIGGSGNEYLNSIVKTNDGYVIGGKSSSNISGDKTENTNGVDDFWILKIDFNGNILWQNTIGGSNQESLSSIVKTTDSGFLLAGFSWSNISGDKTENSNGGFDCWIIKTDSVGAIQWQNTIGGSNQDFLTSAIQTFEGGYLLGGYSTSNKSGDKTENLHGTFGNTDYWIIKMDSSGNILWQNSIGGNFGDYLHCIIQAIDGNYVLAGYSKSNISGDKTENSLGYEDFWVMKITGNYNLIQGKAFADLNGNQIQEPTDPNIIYKKITENFSGRFGFSNYDGYYNVLLLDTGDFEVSHDNLNFFNSLPLTHTGTFASLNETNLNNDFAFNPIGNVNDLCISITPNTLFRPGMLASYSINFSNQGTTNQVSTIVFYPDNNVSFVSASIQPSTITTDSVVFTLGLLGVQQTGQIDIIVNVSNAIPLNTFINSGALILPIANDANPGCNLSFWELFASASFDPNDILVNRSFLYDYEIPSSPDLEYIIRFQNTGNDTAFYVRIDNIISNDLELSSLDIVSASHPCHIEYQSYDNTMKFIFYNIQLPDSNINEMKSHGFVRYKIKPQSSLIGGDSILNNARITFDFNTPIETNTAITEIIIPTGLATTHQSSPPAIFPNPAKNKITIRQTETWQKINTVTIYNLYGQQIKNLEITPSYSTEVDISGLAQGVYFIQVNDKSSSPQKIVKL